MLRSRPARQRGSVRQFDIVSFSAAGGDRFRHLIGTRVLRWPLWGVLLTGLFSALLWEHGGDVLLNQHLGLLLICLIALPLIGGVSTPEKPHYTVIIFAAGSFPPLPDANSIPIGLWPFLWVLGGAHREGLLGISLVVLVTVVATTVMCAAFTPIVYFGSAVRCRCGFNGNR
jgi:hypothetical protein